MACTLQSAAGQQKQLETLVSELNKLSVGQIAGFKLRTEQLMVASYDSRLWCAANTMMGFCSDDSFDYFRYWLIAQGKTVYEKAIKNPDSLVSHIKPSPTVEDYRFEEFGPAPLKVLKDKTGLSWSELPRITSHPRLPQLDMAWSKDPKKAMQMCPDIWARIIYHDMARQQSQASAKGKNAKVTKNSKRK